MTEILMQKFLVTTSSGPPQKDTKLRLVTKGSVSFSPYLTVFFEKVVHEHVETITDQESRRWSICVFTIHYT